MPRPRPSTRSDRRSRPAPERASPSDRPVEAPALEPARAEALARVLGASLVAFALIRALAPFVPGMWLWSVNLQRFLSPLAAWLPWALAVLALVPAVARRLEPLAERLGEALVSRRRATLALAGALALGMLLLPDRTRFVGDFLLRQGTVEQAGAAAVLFPQAMPLDVFLHLTLPRALVGAGLADASGAARLIGAAEAALLAALAVGFARALGLRGRAALAAIAVAVCGGHLGMFTGFGKAFAELVLVVAAIGASGLRAVRHGRGLATCALALALGMWLHRSALAFAPAVAWALWVAWRAHGRALLRRPAEVTGLALSAVGIALVLPRLIATVLRWDGRHVLPEHLAEQGGPWAAALAAGRLVDLPNLLVFLAPLALPACAALAWTRVPRARAAEVALLALLALPLALSVAVIHPAQGIHRDWDDFVALGMALCLLAAWTAGEALRAPAVARGLGAALVVSVAVSAGQWLVHWHDAERGLTRAEAFLTSPPPRTRTERATGWDFIGIRRLRLGQSERAVRALERAVEAAPSPRLLLELGAARWMAGDTLAARATLEDVLRRDPENPNARAMLRSMSAPSAGTAR